MKILKCTTSLSSQQWKKVIYVHFKFQLMWAGNSKLEPYSKKKNDSHNTLDLRKQYPPPTIFLTLVMMLLIWLAVLCVELLRLGPNLSFSKLVTRKRFSIFSNFCEWSSNANDKSKNHKNWSLLAHSESDDNTALKLQVQSNTSHLLVLPAPNVGISRADELKLTCGTRNICGRKLWQAVLLHMRKIVLHYSLTSDQEVNNKRIKMHFYMSTNIK